MEFAERISVLAEAHREPDRRSPAEIMADIDFMKPLIFSLLIIAALAGQSGKQTFTGTITDSMCAEADHSRMRMGPTDAECTIACILAHGAVYVLSDGKDAYTLSDQQTPEKFAALWMPR